MIVECILVTGMMVLPSGVCQSPVQAVPVMDGWRITMSQEPSLPVQTVKGPERSHWDLLAECESGEWINRGESFVEGSARWDASEGTFQGGLQFHPDTWDAFRDADHPSEAYNATRDQQIEVGIRVQESQGWGAWPVCSRLVGLR